MVSVSRVLPAVRASPAAIRSRMRGSNTAVSPITLKRMPLSCSLATSCSRVRRKSCIRIETSSAGRRQFSLEKANRVRNSTPDSAQARTVVRTASTPRRWPAMRGNRRCFAQRPLPSMMIATCRGTVRGAGISRVELSNTGSGGNGRRGRFESGGNGWWRRSRRQLNLAPLDCQQVRFLGLEDLVDLGNIAVGKLLHVGLRVALVVLRNRVLLEQLLQVLVGVAADVAHGNARIFGLVPHHLDQILAP